MRHLLAALSVALGGLGCSGKLASAPALLTDDAGDQDGAAQPADASGTRGPEDATATERDRLPPFAASETDEWLLRCWCAKEAGR